MEAGKSPLKGFQNMLDQCHLVLNKEIFWGQEYVADGTLRSLPTLLLPYVSMILNPSAQDFYREMTWMFLHFSLSLPAVGRQINSQIRAYSGNHAAGHA